MRTTAAALLGAAVLIGCKPIGTGSPLSFTEAAGQSRNLALPRADLADGRISVSGPQGYCIDASTLRSASTGGFAAIASCNILSGGTGPIVEPVLLTVSVSPSPGTAPSPAQLAEALQTELLQSRALSAVTAGQMATGGAAAFRGSDPRHWRGAFLIGGDLVGLALYAPQGSPLVGAQGAAFLNTVSMRIRAESSGAKPIAEQPQPQADPVALRLNRLFGPRDL